MRKNVNKHITEHSKQLNDRLIAVVVETIIKKKKSFAVLYMKVNK